MKKHKKPVSFGGSRFEPGFEFKKVDKEPPIIKDDTDKNTVEEATPSDPLLASIDDDKHNTIYKLAYIDDDKISCDASKTEGVKDITQKPESSNEKISNAEKYIEKQSLKSEAIANSVEDLESHSVTNDNSDQKSEDSKNRLYDNNESFNEDNDETTNDISNHLQAETEIEVNIVESSNQKETKL